ncbi:MAG: tetratricopeptide repeat protein [Porticoccaceae bacterium]|nr:tetratricopeptide repeat protein [Porticoccaceae bacterium]
MNSGYKKWHLSSTTLIVGLLLNPFISAQEPTASDAITNYIRAIDTIESDSSAYSRELADLYLSLGNAYVTSGDFAAAKRAFQRGMQIERVNLGLNSLAQTPYLFSIAETETQLGNYTESQAALETLYNINVETHGESSPAMLPVLEQLLDWYTDSYDQLSRSDAYKSLIVAEDIGERMYRILSNNKAINPSESAEQYRKISHMHYMIARHLEEYGEPVESGFSINNGQQVRSQESSSHMHFRRGKAALEERVKSLEQQPDASMTEKALALIDVGDWYTAFAQRASAKKTYNLAYELLPDDENGNTQRQALFGQPTLIAYTAANRGQTTLPQDLQVTVTVLSSGSTRNPAIIDPPESLSERALNSIYKDIRNMRFRPQWVEGKPTKAEIVLPYASQQADLNLTRK